MSNRISPAVLHRILGIPESTPLSLDDMCRTLSVTVHPSPEISPRLLRFTASLTNVLMQLGVSILETQDAAGPDGRFTSGTVVLVPGSCPDERLAINRVSTLYGNIIVGIYDEPPPIKTDDLPQRKLDAIVGRLAWEMVHMLIFVTGTSWTVCTMNGGVATFATPMPEPGDVLSTLVPKLTAQVVPPKREHLDIRRESLRTSGPQSAAIAADFMRCGKIWSGNSSFLSHTSRDALKYRNTLYRKIVARYLDQRSGMSYGFFARQLPVVTAPAIPGNDHDLNDAWQAEPGKPLPFEVAGKVLFVGIPDVRVVTTRSGCRKTEIDSALDLVEIGLEKGRIYLRDHEGLPTELAAKPSFDTLTILAHAAGNAIVASILQFFRPDAIFPKILGSFGASMTHWHDYPDRSELPEGYYFHGEDNPPVSCSTPQSAAYSLLGKIDAVEQALREEREYRGDIHIEPNHGTNMVGCLSLEATAEFLNRGREQAGS
jgi:hypothetical protein